MGVELLAQSQALLAELRSETSRNVQVPALLIKIVAERRLPEDAEAREMLTYERVGSLRRRMFFMQMEAEHLAYLGEKEQALVSLKRAADRGLIDFCWVDHCPLFEELRRDPSFQAIRAQVKHRADEILAAYREG